MKNQNDNKYILKTKEFTLKRVFGVGLTAALLTTSTAFSQEKKPKDDFKPSGKVWGYFFGDYYYKAGGAKAAGNDNFYVQKGDTTIEVKRWGNSEFAKKAKDDQAFTFRRIYLGYDYQFTPKISSRILLEGSDGVTTGGGNRTVFVKALYLEWKDILFRQTLKLGQISTPTWSTFTEKKWAYRSIEKTIGDMRKISRSNDVGIGLSGTIADIKSTLSDTTQKPKSLLNISYNAMVGNGRGPKPEDNSLKVIYGELIFKIMNKISLEGFVEHDPSSEMYTGGPNSGKKYSTAKTITKEFIGYEHNLFAVGVEILQQVQKNVKTAPIDSAAGTKKDTTDWMQRGISFWARGTVVKDKLYAFARYDMFKNDAVRRGWEYYSDSKNGDVKKYDETFLVIGLDWRPLKNIQVMPNLWLGTYKDMTSNVQDYKKIKRAADAVPRITLLVKF